MIAIVFYAILAGLIVIAAFISNRLIKIFGWSLSPNKFFFCMQGFLLAYCAYCFLIILLGRFSLNMYVITRLKQCFRKTGKKCKVQN